MINENKMTLHLKKLFSLLLSFFCVWFFSFFCNLFGYSFGISNELLFNISIFFLLVFIVWESILNKEFIKKTIKEEKEIYLLEVNNQIITKVKKENNKNSFFGKLLLIFVYFSTLYEQFITYFKKSVWNERIVSIIIGIFVIKNALNQEKLQTDILILSVIWLVLNIILKIKIKYTVIAMLFFIVFCTIFLISGNEITAERSAIWFNMLLIIAAIKELFEARKLKVEK